MVPIGTVCNNSYFNLISQPEFQITIYNLKAVSISLYTHNESCIPYSEKFLRTKKLANLANFIKATKILVCQIFTPYELGCGCVEK